MELDPEIDNFIENTFMASHYILRSWMKGKVNGQYDLQQVQKTRNLIALTDPAATFVEVQTQNTVLSLIDGILSDDPETNTTFPFTFPFNFS